jgi:hypothetical protein
MDGEPPEEGPGVGEAGGGSDGRRAGDGQPLSSSAAMSSPDSPTRVFNE